MPKKSNIKRKQQRHAQRLEDKQIHKAATIAVQHSFAIAMYAAKTVFKDRASNPKMEELIIKMLSIWDKVGDGEVSVETIAASVEAETGIKYNIASGEIVNLRRK
ncbi:MAG: hypothetical protein J6C82_04995 [Clostridia bacterium]|nr:hypothetical protein [Clostridia bacterium]